MRTQGPRESTMFIYAFLLSVNIVVEDPSQNNQEAKGSVQSILQKGKEKMTQVLCFCANENTSLSELEVCLTWQQHQNSDIRKLVINGEI